MHVYTIFVFYTYTDHFGCYCDFGENIIINYHCDVIVKIDCHVVVSVSCGGLRKRFERLSVLFFCERLGH